MCLDRADRSGIRSSRSSMNLCRGALVNATSTVAGRFLRGAWSFHLSELPCVRRFVQTGGRTTRRVIAIGLPMGVFHVHRPEVIRIATPGLARRTDSRRPLSGLLVSRKMGQPRSSMPRYISCVARPDPKDHLTPRPLAMIHLGPKTVWYRSYALQI